MIFCFDEFRQGRNKEQEVRSKDLFGNLTEEMRGLSTEKNEENIIRHLYSNGARLLAR